MNGTNRECTTSIDGFFNGTLSISGGHLESALSRCPPSSLFGWSNHELSINHKLWWTAALEENITISQDQVLTVTFAFVFMVISRSDSDVFVYLDDMLLLELSGTRMTPETSKIELNTINFVVNAMSEWNSVMIPSYPLRIFVASRRAFPLTLTITTDFEKLCHTSHYVTVFELNDGYRNDGQLLLV